MFTGSFDAAWMKAPEAQKTQIVSALRTRHGVKAALSDFRVDDDQIQISFRGPGYAAHGFIGPGHPESMSSTKAVSDSWSSHDLQQTAIPGTVMAIVIDISEY